MRRLASRCGHSVLWSVYDKESAIGKEQSLIGHYTYTGKILFKNNITSLVFYPGHDARSSKPSARNGEEVAEEMAMANSSHPSIASVQTLNRARHFHNGKF